MCCKLGWNVIKRFSLIKCRCCRCKCLTHSAALPIIDLHACEYGGTQLTSNISDLKTYRSARCERLRIQGTDVLICDYDFNAAFLAQTNRRLLTMPLLAIHQINSVLISFDGLLFPAWQLKTAIDHIDINTPSFQCVVLPVRYNLRRNIMIIIKLLVIYAQSLLILSNTHTFLFLSLFLFPALPANFLLVFSFDFCKLKTLKPLFLIAVLAELLAFVRSRSHTHINRG